MQIDIASLTVPVHAPTEADYILTAVLLASYLGGSSAGIQAWSGGFEDGVPHQHHHVLPHQYHQHFPQLAPPVAQPGGRASARTTWSALRRTSRD